jgi:hypothetical protein
MLVVTKKENIMNPILEAAVENLVDGIKANYETYANAVGNPEQAGHAARIKVFADGVTYQAKKNYVKILSGNSVWAFVVINSNDLDFKVGDILKPKGWAGPVRNFARGNVFENDYSSNWSGI